MGDCRLLLCGVWLLTLVRAATCHSHHTDRNLRVLYNSQVNLTCADEQFQPHTAPEAAYQWMLPTGEILNSTSHYASNRYSLHNNGASLIISRIDRPDFGVYFCLVSVPGAGAVGTVHYTVRWAINVDGPYYGDLWEKYSGRCQVGLIAGFATFVVMSLLCLNIDQFATRHDRPADDDQRPGNGRHTGQVSLRSYFPDPLGPSHDLATSAYRNPAFLDEGDSLFLPDTPHHATDHVKAEGQGEGQDEGRGRATNVSSFQDKEKEEPKTSF